MQFVPTIFLTSHWNVDLKQLSLLQKYTGHLLTQYPFLFHLAGERQLCKREFRTCQLNFGYSLLSLKTIDYCFPSFS